MSFPFCFKFWQCPLYQPHCSKEPRNDTYSGRELSKCVPGTNSTNKPTRRHTLTPFKYLQNKKKTPESYNKIDDREKYKIKQKDFTKKIQKKLSATSAKSFFLYFVFLQCHCWYRGIFFR